MKRRAFVAATAAATLHWTAGLRAQPNHGHRIGIILLGGPYLGAVDGLRAGLIELGLAEGQHFRFELHDARGDLASVEAAAKRLEAENVDLIYSLATSVTMAVKRATVHVPIVFYAGADPVEFGLVSSLRRPGGRLTGVHGRFSDLAAKRLQLLKEMLPGLRRVVTFYSPENPAARGSINVGRQAARDLKIELIERHVLSVAELRAALDALQPGQFDAFYYVADAMMTSESEMIIAAALTKKLPTMFADSSTARRGALASYGTSYVALGRLSARIVRHVLTGGNPADIPVEQFDRLQLVVNLRTAKALGIAVPEPIVVRADEIIE